MGVMLRQSKTKDNLNKKKFVTIANGKTNDNNS